MCRSTAQRVLNRIRGDQRVSNVRVVLTRRQGFTLLEVLVASTILSIVLAALYTVFSQTLTSHSRTEQQVARSRAARIVLLRLGDELRASPPSAVDSFVPLVGEVQRRGRFPDTTLTFTSALPSLHSIPGVDGGLSTVHYRLVPEESDSSLYRLIRQVSHNTVEKHESLTQSAALAYPLISGVRGFRTRFFDGRRWQDEWGQGPERTQLPRAVEIRLYLDTSERRLPQTAEPESDRAVQQFSTLVELPLVPAARGAV